MNVLVKPAAVRAIDTLVKYIAYEIQMPETGLKYGNKMIDFANNLSKSWPAYKTCRYKPWAELGLKCAVFNKKYVFAFKIINNNVVIYFIRYGKILF